MATSRAARVSAWSKAGAFGSTSAGTKGPPTPPSACGAVSFAGSNYRVGNGYRGRLAGVRIVGDTVQITVDGVLIRTHQSRHDKSKEFSALAQPNGRKRRKDVA